MENTLDILIKRYKKGLISRRELLKHINKIILSIPSYYNNYDKDIQHEFYAYILSKIEKLISIYKKIDNAKFITWFNLVLKREYINFIKKINKNKINTIELIDNVSQENKTNEIKLPSLKSILFTSLTEKERKIFELKYGFGLNNDFPLSIETILINHERKNEIKNSIIKRYNKLIEIQKKIDNEYNINKLEELKIKEANIIKSKRRLENKFNKFSTFPTNKWVGKQLGLSDGTVAAHLHKIKMKLLIKIKECA